MFVCICIHECERVTNYKFSRQHQSRCAPIQKLKRNCLRNIPLTIPTPPTSVSGKRRGAQGEFCSAGDDGQPGLAA